MATPTPTRTPKPTPSPNLNYTFKAAMIKEIGEQLAKFKGSCFDKNDVKIGDIDKFQSAINTDLIDPFIPPKSLKYIKKPNAEAQHQSYTYFGVGGVPLSETTNVIALRFDPRGIPLTPKQRESLVHEMTHHTEAILGTKQPTDIPNSNPPPATITNPAAERNTLYQEGVINALGAWDKAERAILSYQTPFPQSLTAWKILSDNLTNLEAGSVAGNTVPDKLLFQMTGFNATLEKITSVYLSEKCGSDLKTLVTMAAFLPKFDYELKLKSSPISATVGQQTDLEVTAYDSSSLNEVTLPKSVNSRFEWNFPDGTIVRGSSAKFLATEEKDYVIIVRLIIPYGGKEYTFGEGQITLTPKAKSPSPDTSGKIELKVPAEALATEFVDASAIVPKAMLPDAKLASWYPESCTTGNKIDSAKLQFQNPRSGKPEIQYINYSLRNAEGSIGEAKAQVLVKPVLFGGSAPGIWKPGSGPAGVRLERTPAIRMMGDKESGKVIASVEALWMDSFAPKSLAEIEDQLKKEKGANTGLTLEPIEFAGFKGFLLDMNYVRQGSSYTGYVDLGAPDTSRSGHGMAIKGCIAVKFSYSASGGGMIRGEKPNIWWNDVPFILSQTKTAAEEAKSVLKGLTLTEDGRFREMPYKGPKLDGSDLASVKLVLSPSQLKLKTGDIVSVRAVIENEQNAEKPIEYLWTGDHAGSGANVTIIAGKPGKQSISVNVPTVGMASAEFEVTEDPATKAVLAAAEKVTRAKKLSSDGALDEAIGLIDEAAALDPMNPEAASLGSRWKSDRSRITRHVQEANSRADANKFQEADKEIASAKALNPKYPPVLEAERSVAAKAAKYKASAAEIARRIQEGNRQYEGSEYRPAIESYTKAIASDPRSAEAYAGRCLAKRGTNDPGAAADCEEALRLDPNNAAAYRGRSMIRRVNNDLPGALADANKAVSLAPAEYRAYLTRGLAYDALKDYTKALADYEHSLALNSAYLPSYLYRGTDRLRLKDYIGARNDLDRYLTAEPNSSIGHNNRGSARENLNDRDGAIADYEAAVRLDPSNQTAKNNLDRLRKLVAQPQPSPGPGSGPPVGKLAYYPLDLTPLGGKKGQPRELNGIQVDDGSYLRLKGTDNERLTYTLRTQSNVVASGIAVVSVLDDSIHVLQGMTIARMTVVKDSGNEAFQIKAGVTSSEWNRSDGPKHSAAEQPAVFQLSRPGRISEIRFDYVDSKVEKWWGHAPGFCLKGITIISGAGAASAKPQGQPVDLTQFGGKWQSEWGLIDFRVSGSRVTGTYPHDSGRISATLSADGRTMEGTWAESPSYQAPNDGGRLTFVLSPDGRMIDGEYWYGNDRYGGKWTGKRIVDAAPPAPAMKPVPKSTPVVVPSKAVQLLTNMNQGTVFSKPTAPSEFDTNRNYMITSILTYHWNNGSGTPRPGTISIRSRDGRVFGPYEASGLRAGSVPNAFWEIKPNIILPPGFYTIVDSDPATWSQNSGSGGRGFTTIYGYLADSR